MSELTPCNLCTLNSWKVEAESKRLKVIQRKGWKGGIDIYLVPVVLAVPKKIDEHFRKLYWRGWFMKLSETCCC